MNINNYIKNNFPRIPSIKHNINQQIVSGDLYTLIPFGKKSHLWFTYFNNQNLCILIQDNKILIQQLSFDIELCYGKYGTILYGTILKNNTNRNTTNNTNRNTTNNNYFYIEDIVYYKGSFISTKFNKIKLIPNFFKHINPIINTKYQLGICSPTVSIEKKDIIKKCANSNFNVYAIKTINFDTKNNICNYKYLQNYIQNIPTTDIFHIKADVQNDIYKLYKKNPKTTFLEFQSYALIPDYKTSVLMNKLFRNIKENNNLDLLEESDSEDEFENIQLDKYVKDIDETIEMKCEFSKKFNKWIPISVS